MIYSPAWLYTAEHMEHSRFRPDNISRITVSPARKCVATQAIPDMPGLEPGDRVAFFHTPDKSNRFNGVIVNDAGDIVVPGSFLVDRDALDGHLTNGTFVETPTYDYSHPKPHTVFDAHSA